MKYLAKLTMADCFQLDSDLFKNVIFSVCQHCQQLQTLSVGRNHVTVDQQFIEPLSSLINMVVLELYDNCFTFSGLQSLSNAVKDMKQLEKLDLCQCNLKDSKECTKLTSCLSEHCPKLKAFSLADNKIEIMPQMLKSFKKLVHLEELDLYKNAIKLNTLKLVDKTVKHVKNLDIKDCPVIGKAGIADEEVNKLLLNLGEENPTFSELCMKDGILVNATERS